ncbi:MAG: hypothetical protein ACYDHC_05185 [Desulfuromonadaceae bacterium]
MTKKDFEDFLNKVEQEKAEVPIIDWNKEKDEWLAYLEQLYSIFEECLSEYTKKGAVDIQYQDVEISEENLGTYSARLMTIKLGNEQIKLKPIGTNLIGAKGRVDMTGRLGSAMLILVDSRMKSASDHIKITVHTGNAPIEKEEQTTEQPIVWEWKFVSAPPTRKYQPVNEETIYSVIMEVSNG